MLFQPGLRKIGLVSLSRWNVKRNFQISAAIYDKWTEVRECNGAREIVLNDPKTRNSLSKSMMCSILEGLNKDLDTNDIRCIVLSANGPIWSAGHNFKELGQHNAPGEDKEIFKKCVEIIATMQALPVPVIAKVNGLVAAAGCQLVASCDIIVCSEKSSFSTPGINYGLFCSTPGIAIARTMPRSKAAYMLMTGLPISGQDAYISGLVSRVVPQEELNDEVQKIVDTIKGKSRDVLKLGKEFYYQQINMSLQEAYCNGVEVMSENLRLPDGQEGVKSFLEKRAPVWKKK